MSEPRLDVAGQDAAERRRSPWWGVHASRYLFAKPLARGRVLDIACGTGYGFALLQAHGTQVIGVDADLEAVHKARQESGGSAFALVGDGGQLPFVNRTFDTVTSFETIEHLRARSAFVGELRRVLTDDGVCVISTPNANYTQPVNGTPRNPFHVHEYTPDEFAGELRACFRTVDLLGQTLNDRFVISPFWDDQQRLPRTWAMTMNLWIWRVLNRLPRAVHDPASQAMWGHPLLPAEHDYDFKGGTTAAAPVLVAICRGRAS